MTKSYLECLAGWCGQQLTQREALYLLQHVTQRSASAIYAHPTTRLLPAEEEYFMHCLQARVNHIPLAYLTQRQAFWDLDFFVNPHCFIPRADTECMIEFMLEQLPTNKQTVLDLGTGSGAIGLTLKKHRPAWEVTLVDLCPAALRVALTNAHHHQLDVQLQQSNWYQQVTGTFDVIVANPPYISRSDVIGPEILAEPSHALFAAEDGMQALRLIIVQGYALLSSCLIVEHGEQQGAQVIQLFLANAYQATLSLKDLQGHHRATVGFKGKTHLA